MAAQLIGVAIVYFVFTQGLGWSSVLFLVVGLISMFIYSLYANQEQILYQTKVGGLPPHLPDEQYPPGFRNPGNYNLDYEVVTLKTSDGETLNSWFIPAHILVDGKLQAISNMEKEPEAAESDEEAIEVITAGARRIGASQARRQAQGPIPTLLFLHENAGTINMRLPNLFMMAVALRCNVFIIDYRGYGLSTGTPSEDGLIEDAHTALNHLLQRKDIDASRIYLFGRSLGGAVALALATRKDLGDVPIKGLIVENTFTSISDLVDKIFPFVKFLKPFILRLKWESIKRISSLSHPICFLAGADDEMVPAHHMDTLYEKTPGDVVKCKFTVAGGNHNTTWLQGKEPYIAYFRQFLQYTGGMTTTKQDEAIVVSGVSIRASVKELERIDRPQPKDAELDRYVVETLQAILSNYPTVSNPK